MGGQARHRPRTTRTTRSLSTISSQLVLTIFHIKADRRSGQQSSPLRAHGLGKSGPSAGDLHNGDRLRRLVFLTLIRTQSVCRARCRRAHTRSCPRALQRSGGRDRGRYLHRARPSRRSPGDARRERISRTPAHRTLGECPNRCPSETLSRCWCDLHSTNVCTVSRAHCRGIRYPGCGEFSYQSGCVLLEPESRQIGTGLVSRSIGELHSFAVRTAR